MCCLCHKLLHINCVHVHSKDKQILRESAADEMIALEVDGPHHFTANTMKPLGEMLARQKLLQARGWTVISVPFFRWSNKTTEYQQTWLQKVCLSFLALKAALASET